MEDIVQIQAPLPHIRLGQHLAAARRPADADRHRPAQRRGARPRSRPACAGKALRVEDIELVIPTHHHLDHSGLIATIVARSGARVAALDRAADYGARYVERSDGRSLLLARADAPSRGARSR